MSSTSRPTLTSGWWPVLVLAASTTLILVAFGTSIADVAIFSAYVTFGLAVPGMLWLRFLRGRSGHIAEDLALGLAIGYCLELATYLGARAIGAPQLFLLWPAVTLVVFAAVPGLRGHWRSGAERAPVWWSWSIAAALGFLLVYSAGTFFAQHGLTGTYVPYVDMPYHLSLIGELKNHLPPEIPYVTGVPLAYHWFFYVDAAATSWATGIEPATLLYRLSGLPMFVLFVVLTAGTARRVTGVWWSGPVAVAIGLFGVSAAPHGWIPGSVFDSQTLATTWISPTNLFGLALFAAVLRVFVDLLDAETTTRRSEWILLGLLIFGVAGAKASLLPILIVGLLTTLVGVAITRRRMQRSAAGGLALAVSALIAATILLFRGSAGGVSIGLAAMKVFPLATSVGVNRAHGAAVLAIVGTTLAIAIMLWSGLWAGVFGLLARRRETAGDPRLLLLLGVCAGALGAVVVFAYPGVNQLYYLRGAAGAFGVITAAGLAVIAPTKLRRGPLFAACAGFALAGALSVIAIRALGPTSAPTVAHVGLRSVLFAMGLPEVALAAVVVIALVAARRLERGTPLLRGSVPFLLVAVTMGFGVPSTAAVLGAPLTALQRSGPAVPGDGAAAARWLRDHSDPSDIVATNLHCLVVATSATACDARHFWVSAYAERHILVEGWAYTTDAYVYSQRLGVDLRAVPFWDPGLLAENDQAFTAPTATGLANLRHSYGVRWLFADLSRADGSALAAMAQLRERIGDFAVYELR